MASGFCKVNNKLKISSKFYKKYKFFYSLSKSFKNPPTLKNNLSKVIFKHAMLIIPMDPANQNKI